MLTKNAAVPSSPFWNVVQMFEYVVDWCRFNHSLLLLFSWIEIWSVSIVTSNRLHFSNKRNVIYFEKNKDKFVLDFLLKSINWIIITYSTSNYQYIVLGIFFHLVTTRHDGGYKNITFWLVRTLIYKKKYILGSSIVYHTCVFTTEIFLYNYIFCNSYHASKP